MVYLGLKKYNTAYKNDIQLIQWIFLIKDMHYPNNKIVAKLFKHTIYIAFVQLNAIS